MQHLEWESIMGIIRWVIQLKLLRKCWMLDWFIEHPLQWLYRYETSSMSQLGREWWDGTICISYISVLLATRYLNTLSRCSNFSRLAFCMLCHIWSTNFICALSFSAMLREILGEGRQWHISSSIDCWWFYCMYQITSQEFRGTFEWIEGKFISMGRKYIAKRRRWVFWPCNSQNW